MKRKNHKDEYYREYYLNKKLFNSVDLAAKMECNNKKKAAGDDDEGGLSSYIGEKSLNT